MHRRKFARPLWESYDSYPNFSFHSSRNRGEKTSGYKSSYSSINVYFNYTQNLTRQKAFFSNFKPGSSLTFPCHVPVFNGREVIQGHDEMCILFSHFFFSVMPRVPQVGSVQIFLFRLASMPMRFGTSNRHSPRCRRISVTANGFQAIFPYPRDRPSISALADELKPANWQARRQVIFLPLLAFHQLLQHPIARHIIHNDRYNRERLFRLK